MRSLPTRHPAEEQLLRYADGELPGREASKMRAHLEACWECRAEVDDLQRAVSECVRYRKAVLGACLPSPPAPWPDIYKRFAEADALPDRPSLLDRLAAAAGTPMRNPRRWLAAATTCLVIWAVIYQFRHAPSVQAAALLRKAVTAAESRPGTLRRIQIRTRTERLTRLIGPGQRLSQTSKSVSAEAADTATLASMEALFSAAHYSWEDPLSAKSYLAWREQLSGKQDEVTTIGDGPSSDRSCYRIRTTTSSGELVEATLKLRVPDLRAVEGTLQFRNHEQVEMTELVEASSPISEAVAAAAAKVPIPPQPAPAGVRQPANTVPPATPGDELQVFAALHHLGADLGDPIDVARAGGRILVTGVGIDSERRQQIHDALGSMPRVVVRFWEPAAALRPEGQVWGDIPAGSKASRFQAQLEKQMGGRASVEQLADEVLELSESMMSRVYALRRLAERFPQEIESQLTVEGRQLLKKLRQEHAAPLTQRVTQIQRRMDPVLASLGAAAPGAAADPASSDSWQAATEELFRTAREVERLLAAALGGAAPEMSSEELPSRLVANLAQLGARAQAYERLTQ